MTHDELLIAFNESVDKIKEIEKKNQDLENENNIYKNNVENISQNYFRIGYAEGIQQLVGLLNHEISSAIQSNRQAQLSRAGTPKDDHSEEFFSWCNGKIDALRGIEDFIEETSKNLINNNCNNTTAYYIVDVLEKFIMPFIEDGSTMVAIHEIKTIIQNIKEQYGV